MEPQNTLAANALEWCKSIGSEAQTVQEAIGDAAVAKAVQVLIRLANYFFTFFRDHL